MGDMATVAAVFGISFVASALQGATGFGFGMITMALMPVVLPLDTASAVVTCNVFFISLVMVWKLRHAVDLRLVLFPLGGALLFVPVGVAILAVVDETLMEMLLGFVIVAISIFLLLEGSSRVRIAPSAGIGVAAGAISGMMSGMFNLGGPALVVYFMQTAPHTLSYKASLDVVYLVSAALRLGTLVVYGVFPTQSAVYALVAVAGSAVGTLTGFTVFTRMSRKVLSAFSYSVLIVAGTSLIFSH